MLLREQFIINTIRGQAIILANTWGIDPQFRNQRRIVKKYFDEIDNQFCFSNREHKFRVTIFNTIIYIITSQLEMRLNEFFTVISKFKILNPK